MDFCRTLPIFVARRERFAVICTVSIVLSAVFVASPLTSGSAAAEELKVAIRTFIPKEHPSINGYMKPVPGTKGPTMLPDAPGPAQCFGTDDRGFSTEPNISSRFGGMIIIDTRKMTVSVSPILGTTVEFDCTTGKVVCTEVSGGGGFEASHSISDGVITITFKGEASNPCLAIAPDIEFSGTVIVDTAARTVSLSGTTDVFPAFEGVLFAAGKSSVLFEQAPAEGSTPADLVTSTANRPVKGGPISY